MSKTTRQHIGHVAGSREGSLPNETYEELYARGVVRNDRRARQDYFRAPTPPAKRGKGGKRG